MLAVMLVVTSMIAGMPTAKAYTTLSVATGTKVTLTEKLLVSESGTAVPNVSYTFTAGAIQGFTAGSVQYYCETDLTSATNTGVKPTGDSGKTVTFGPGDGTGVITVEKTVDFDLGGLEFTEPGIYYWTITKTKAGASSATNEVDTLYLIARVNDVGGTLTPIYSINTDLTTASKRNEIVDNYPANNHSLTLTKMVTGNQGSKDQYFKFDVTLSGLGDIAGHDLDVTLSGATGTPATTLYGETPNQLNPTTIRIKSDGTATATFWLKHNQTIVIDGILEDASYTVTEDNAFASGYDTKYKIGSTETDGKATGTQDIGTGVTVIYTNTKASDVPTGIVLDMAAPLAGIALVGLLMAVLMVSKKRRTHA